MRMLLLLILLLGRSTYANNELLTIKSTSETISEEKVFIAYEELMSLDGNPYFLGQSLALSGDKGNGGDICENKIDIIASDIERWIHEEGHISLKLSEGITHTAYMGKMLDAIKVSKVTCIDKVITVENKEKICVNFIDSSNTPLIVCNREKILNSETNDKYRLIHHELAGVAGLEVGAINGSSNYSISNQITAFLEKELVTRLSVASTDSERLTYINSRGIKNISKGSTYQLKSLLVIDANSGGKAFRKGRYGQFECFLNVKPQPYERLIKPGFELKVSNVETIRRGDYEARISFSRHGSVDEQPFLFLECGEVDIMSMTIGEMRIALREYFHFVATDPVVLN
jgi:hypothetical protein